MNFHGRTIALTVLLTICITAILAGTAAADVQTQPNSSEMEPLVDDGEYWIGDVLYNDTIVGPDETIVVTDLDGDRVREQQTTSGGELILDTTDLETGDDVSSAYFINRGEERLATIWIQKEEFTITGKETRHVSDGGQTVEYDIRVASNREGSDAIFDGDPEVVDPLLEGQNVTELADDRVAVENFSLASTSINVSALDAPQYYFEVESSSGVVQDSVLIDTESAATTNYRQINPKASIDTNGWFWEGHTVSHSYSINGSESEAGAFEIRSDDGTVIRTERATDGLSNYSIEENLGTPVKTNASEAIERTWRAEESWTENGINKTLFHSRQQYISTSITKDRLEPDGNTTLSISSNRDGYDLIVWSETISPDALARAAPDIEEVDDGVGIKNATSKETIEINGDQISGGNHTIHATPIDHKGNDAVSLEIEEAANDDDSSGDDGNDDGGSSSSSGGGGGGIAGPVETNEPEFTIDSLSISDIPTAGDEATVSATLVNEGDAGGGHTVELTVDGTVVAESDTVVLRAGESEKIEFKYTFENSGERLVSVGSESTEVEVSDSDEQREGDHGQPDEVEENLTSDGENASAPSNLNC